MNITFAQKFNKTLKYHALTVIFSSLACYAQAQIEVGPNNNVGIGIGGTVNSKLSVGHAGLAKANAYFFNNANEASKSALYAKIGTNNAIQTWSYGIITYNEGGTGNCVGLRATSYPLSPSINGKHIGLIGEAGLGLSGYNYGVFGKVMAGTAKGAGVYGTMYEGERELDALYAGYFYGKTRVEGELWTTSGTITTSDKGAKKDIRKLEKNSLDNLKKVSAIRFKYKTPDEMRAMAVTDSLTTQTDSLIEQIYGGEHIGLIAQEVEDIYPELVKTDANGLKGVDYTGLIPVLIEAIKEQQLAIEALTNEVNTLKKKKN
jgi:hypothetical protein